MCKACLSLLLCCNLAQAENWTKDSFVILEKGWSSGDGCTINGELVMPLINNDNNCGIEEGTPDKSLRFDIQYLRSMIGPSFDVNNIYVDGIAGGEYALEVLQAEFAAHGHGFTLPYLWQKNHFPKDWAQNGGYIYACVGGIVRGLVVPDSTFEKIILWYKDPNKTTVRNISATDICSANGSNWLQKIFVKYRSSWLDSFCQDSGNKANLTLDTSSNTATITSKVPLNYNGDKSITIPFSQAGVTSAQVKAGIGLSSGGIWQTNPGSGGGNYGNDPDTPSADVHINHLKVKREDQNNFHTESGTFLNPGQSIAMYAEGRIENRSNYNCDYVRMGYKAYSAQ